MSGQPPASPLDLVAELESLGAQRLPTREELHRNQTRMLARFARANVPEKKWKHLQACDENGCPHDECCAACWFGERLAILRLMREAYHLLEGSGQRLWFVTIVDPRYRQKPKRLKRVSLRAMQTAFRRRIARLKKVYGAVRVVGAIEVCFDQDRDGRCFWYPHTHVVIAVNCDKADLRRHLMPYGRRKKNARPVEIKEVTNLANALGYVTKRWPANRAAFSAKTGRQDRNKRPVSARYERRHDRWLLSVKSTERLILCGVKRVQGRLVVINTS